MAHLASKRSSLRDLVLYKGLATSPREAEGLILAGRVLVNNQVLTKPGQTVPTRSVVNVKESKRFVSRGGEKLLGALQAFGLSATGATAVDLGASTGGFTHCLLRSGARIVFAVDIGRGLLDWSLRSDARVRCLEGRHARDLQPEWFEGACISLVTADLSFISVTVINQPLLRLARVQGQGFDCVALLKPQFEAPRHQVEPGGVVRDPNVINEILENTIKRSENTGLLARGVSPSVLRGPKGNQEMFIHFWVPPR